MLHDNRSAPGHALLAVSFLVIFGGATASAQALLRGPYVQRIGPDSAIVRFRTDVPVLGWVRYGTAGGLLGSTGTATSVTTEHEISIEGLLADQVYYYAIGQGSTALAGGDEATYFRTAPAATTGRPVRFWVVGDSGTGDSAARNVRDSYYRFSGEVRTDFWLMLGDNAYPNGSDAYYQTAVFQNMYESLLRTSPLWPCLGNHDIMSSDSPTQAGPYFTAFSLPRSAEAGGAASGTEAYYSFDFANVHVLVLDSADSNTALGGPMYQFAEADLQANTKAWTIAMFHQPPYSKGSHDSDVDSDMIVMRTNFLPLLEGRGVDLVLCGHSHSYERSALLRGHYGSSSTLVPSMVVNGGDGQINGDGAYIKPGTGPVADSGTVYMVIGCSGKVGTTPTGHPAMIAQAATFGSLVIDVQGFQLDARFLDLNGAILDSCTIVKGGAVPVPITHELFPQKSVWRYLDTGTDLGQQWRALEFDDAAWKLGSGTLGYGSGIVDTPISFGPSAGNKFITTYFRRSFSIADPDAVTALRLFADFDDGFVAYVNGKEVARRNMPSGPVQYSTLGNYGDGGFYRWVDLGPLRGVLRPGENTLAIEVHQVSASSGDLVWDAGLTCDVIPR